MYARKVKDRILTFGVSGMLWNRSLVMYDRETNSLWSHILGEAMDGALKGAQLETIPSVMTDWKSWRSEHPGTTVLAMSRTAREYLLEFQRKPETFVLGIELLGTARAYPFDLLAERRVVNDSVGDEPVVVTFDPASTAARMFRRSLDGRTLTFRPAPGGRMTDAETGSIWSSAGRAEAGKLKGKQLAALPAIVSYRRVWHVFHPDSSTFTGK